MKQCLTTFDYLVKEKSIFHRDIKPENILVTCVKPFEVKIADFGVSKTLLN
jgi:serine/threonine protein kinase